MHLLKRVKRMLVPVCACLVVLVLGLHDPLSGGDKKLRLANFSLKDLQGNVVELSQLLGKGPIVIDFWATWCKPCVKELPHLNKIQKDYRDRGLVVLAISEDSPWSVSKVKSFITGNRYEFTVPLDTNGDVLRKYGLLGTPYTYVLNARGEILYKHFGYRPGDEVSLREEIEKAFAAEDDEGEGEAMEGEGSAGG